jgi:NADPH-dependent curcumin reductase CurA
MATCGKTSFQREIRFKEDVLEGIERMPEAFLRLLHGKNFGRQTVRIS